MLSTQLTQYQITLTHQTKPVLLVCLQLLCVLAFLSLNNCQPGHLTQHLLESNCSVWQVIQLEIEQAKRAKRLCKAAEQVILNQNCYVALC